VIVQCPYCATRYRLDPARLTASGARLKCSRCEHVFPAPASAQEGEPAPAPARSRPSPPEESLTLPFEEASWESGADETPAEDLTLGSIDDDEFTMDAEEPAAIEEAAPATAVPAPTPPRPPPPPRPVRHVQPAVQRDAGTAEPGSHRRSAEDDGERGKTVAVLGFLVAAVVGYALLATTLFVDPGLSDRWLGHLPWIGTLRDDRLLTRKVALSDVTGSYQRIKDGKEVFVITGKAMNTAPVPLHGVQVAGKLYDEGGRSLDERSIHCGNAISTKVLKDLTVRELSVLQTLQPPARFAIEPGESAAFVIVFMDPPRAAVAFTTQVVAVHRQA
jgi:predicted Zn finger-like uncharacterized protein